MPSPYAVANATYLVNSRFIYIQQRCVMMKFKILWRTSAQDAGLSIFSLHFYPCSALFIHKQSMYNLDSEPVFFFFFGNTKCLTRFLELVVQIIVFPILFFRNCRRF